MQGDAHAPLSPKIETSNQIGRCGRAESFTGEPIPEGNQACGPRYAKGRAYPASAVEAIMAKENAQAAMVAKRNISKLLIKTLTWPPVGYRDRDRAGFGKRGLLTFGNVKRGTASPGRHLNSLKNKEFLRREASQGR